jgi:hypothetical protein
MPAGHRAAAGGGPAAVAGQRPCCQDPWPGQMMDAMRAAPDGPAAERPHEWLALPGGRVRPVVSEPGDDGDIELLPYAAWLARQRPACQCGRPRLGSGRTCGAAACIAALTR